MKLKERLLAATAGFLAAIALLYAFPFVLQPRDHLQPHLTQLGQRSLQKTDGSEQDVASEALPTATASRTSNRPGGLLGPLLQV